MALKVTGKEGTLSGILILRGREEDGTSSGILDSSSERLNERGRGGDFREFTVHKTRYESLFPTVCLCGSPSTCLSGKI